MLEKLAAEPQYLSKDKQESEEVGITSIDFEEQNAGYQAAYSRLAASEAGVTDPVGYIQNPLGFVGQTLKELVQKKPNLRGILSSHPDTQTLCRRLMPEGFTM